MTEIENYKLLKIFPDETGRELRGKGAIRKLKRTNTMVRAL